MRSDVLRTTRPSLFKRARPHFQLVSLALLTAGARAGVIVSESFNYRAGALLTASPGGGTGWTGNWSGGTWTAQAGSLPYIVNNQIMGHAGGRARSTGNSNAIRSINLGGGPAIGNTPGEIWVSMVAQQTGGAANSGYLGVQLPTGGAGNFLFFGKPFNESNWGLDGGTGSVPHRVSTIPASTRALLVMRIDMRSGLDDVRLWINPPLNIEPDDSTANVVALNFRDFQNISTVAIQTGSPLTGEIDEVRMGTEYEDVTPFSKRYDCNNQTWSLVSQDIPPVRDQGSMVYFEQRAASMLFGGSNVPNDTWEWDGTSWSMLNTANRPPARHAAGMATDTNLGRIVLFGGVGGITGYRNDTWEFNRVVNDWFQAASGGPPGRTDGVLAFDKARNNTVLFGGSGPTTNFSDTWIWVSATSTWTQVNLTGTAPPARQLHAMAYDPVRQRVVLFGGGGGTGVLGDTWEWDGVVWGQVSTNGPAARWAHAMAFDSKCNRIVLHGGSNDSGTQLADTWEWDGALWQQVESMATARNLHAMCYDDVRRRMVMQTRAPGNLAQTWERRCVCEQDEISRDPNGVISFPPNTVPGSINYPAPIVIDQGPVNTLFPSLNTTTIDWLYNFPCNPSVGGDPPPADAYFNDCDQKLAALGITGVDCDEIAAKWQEWEQLIEQQVQQEVDPFNGTSPPVVPYAYTPRAGADIYCPCPEEDYLFGGRDIVFVHGLRLDPLFERLACTQATAPGAYTQWPAQMTEFYTGYWHQGAVRYWQDHIQEYLTSRGYKNRYIIVSYASTQRFDVAGKAVMRQIADAMELGTGVVDPLGRNENNFGTPSFVVVSHSTGSPVTDIVMSAASRFPNLGGAFIPQLCKGHVALQGAFGGSRYATGAIVIAGYLTLNPPVIPGWLCQTVNVILELVGGTSNPCRLNCPPPGQALNYFSPLAQSNLVDLVPVVMHHKWGGYQDTTPVKTLTLSGGHATSLAPMKFLLLQGFDDNTLGFDAQLANPNHPLLRPAGFRASTTILSRELFDRGLWALVSEGGRGHQARSIGYFIDQVVDKIFGGAPPIGLVQHPLLVAGTSTPNLSPSDMLQPVLREYKLNGGYNVKRRRPNHLALMQSAADHFAGPNGRDYNDSFPNEHNDEETWVVDDMNVFANVPNVRYTFDNHPLVRSVDAPQNHLIRRARPISHSRSWFGRILSLLRLDWERFYLMLPDTTPLHNKTMYDWMYQTVLTQRIWTCNAVCPPPCPGDTNGDGVVDLSDLSSLLAHFGGSGGLGDGDVDGNGQVDLTDLSQMLAVFGTNCQ